MYASGGTLTSASAPVRLVHCKRREHSPCIYKGINAFAPLDRTYSCVCQSHLSIRLVSPSIAVAMRGRLDMVHDGSGTRSLEPVCGTQLISKVMISRPAETLFRPVLHIPPTPLNGIARD